MEKLQHAENATHISFTVDEQGSELLLHTAEQGGGYIAYS